MAVCSYLALQRLVSTRESFRRALGRVWGGPSWLIQPPNGILSEEFSSTPQNNLTEAVRVLCDHSALVLTSNTLHACAG